MRICYNPLLVNDSTMEGWTLSSEGHADVPQCRGVKVVEGNTVGDQSWCDAGSMRLVLNLTASKLTECGTNIVSGVSKFRKSVSVTHSLPCSVRQRWKARNLPSSHEKYGAMPTVSVGALLLSRFKYEETMTYRQLNCSPCFINRMYLILSHYDYASLRR